MPAILIIDDDNQVCTSLTTVMKNLGHVVECAHTLEEGLAYIHSYPYDAVFLDVGLPDGDGLNAISNIRTTSSSPEVIIITGEGDPEGAELAITCGAWDYITKPLGMESIVLTLMRVIQYREERSRQKSHVSLKRDNIIGKSQGIRDCLDIVAQSAESSINVLITGETGTGKEQFAKAVHENSLRNKNNFVIVDCAALPENLVESVLFGHVKGAFTGADRNQEGLIKQADGGTLFLDEVGELPAPVQKTFLRVLQEHRFRPVGSKNEIASDFRLITATNRDLDQMVKTGEFRKDLLFRIRSATISVPSLRERGKDVRDLALFYINRICKIQGIDTKGFSPEFIEILMAYEWPGNVRELINAIEVAVNIARSEPTLFPKHLPKQIRINVTRSSIRNDAHKVAPQLSGKDIFEEKLPSLKVFREKIVLENEKKYLEKLMKLTGGDVEEACRISAIGKSRLYGLIKDHGIAKGC